MEHETFKMIPASRFMSHENGFTLVEALLALVILSIAILPALFLSSSITTTTATTQNNLIAANLAQEGIEIIRAIRDTNWFTGQSFDANLSDGQYRIEWDSNTLTPVGSNPALKVNNGFYNYSTGTDTIFRRSITISHPSASDIRVISDVTWTERGGRDKNIKIESHLFNWK